VRLPFAGTRLLQTLQEAPNVGRRPQEVGGLDESPVIVEADEHRITALGRDLDRVAIFVDVLDQGRGSCVLRSR
jgi:hypothetical protein